jgi:hypothetical protein
MSLPFPLVVELPNDFLNRYESLDNHLKYRVSLPGAWKGDDVAGQVTAHMS